MGKTKKNLGGRPTVMTEQVLEKLERAYTIGCSDRQACAMANISCQTLYDFQKREPWFKDAKERWKDRQFVKALETIDKSLENTRDAQWFLERKSPETFGKQDRTEHIHKIELTDSELKDKILQLNRQVIDVEYEVADDEPKQIESS
jgi:hypothetical protein